MKQKINTIEQFCKYLDANYSYHKQTIKLIQSELPKLGCFEELLKQEFTENDIIFAIRRRIKLEHHYCPVCGREIHVYKFNRYPNTCSVRCGNLNSLELRKKNLLKKYGVEYPLQAQQVKDKYKKTMEKRYGGYTFQSEELLKKVTKTNLERYGVEVSGSNKELHKKNVETCLKKYGVTHTSKLKENRAKAHTTRQLHKKENPNYLKEIKQKTENTCLKKYGVKNVAQCRDIRIKSQSKYLYNGINFDSSWELAYYIWLTDNKISFVYQPNILFEYTYKKKTHSYHPDFEVNGKLVEIKGNQYFNADKTKMICPYDHTLDGLFNAKYKCMLKNNIQIICTEEIQQYLVYINEKYGIIYLQSFKRKKNV